MKHTTPEVYLISKPALNTSDIQNYLYSVGGLEWYDRVRVSSESDAEALVEFAGRLCYRSWKAGLNPNVTKIREDSDEYVKNLLSSLHGSVLEHAQTSWVFHNVSRVFTHELVRHRAGVAISQESLRYVRLTAIGFRVPEVLKNSETERKMLALIEQIEDVQKSAAEEFGLDDPKSTFKNKKEVTSAMRRIAPLGLSTSICWSANFRTLRFVIEQRTAPGAEEEIRLVFDTVATRCKREFPSIFQDFERATDGSWRGEYRKV